MVTVLNQDYSFLNKVKLKRALAMMRNGKVIVEKASDKVLRSEKEETPVPLILRMVYFVKSIYKRGVKWTKSNVKIRDNYTCQYCDAKRDINVDHIIPKSKGGKDTFDNTVAACKTCNNDIKGDKTLQEAGMYFFNRHFKPRTPTVAEFTRKLNTDRGLNDFFTELGIA